MAGLTKALDDRMIRIETALATHGERLARIEGKLIDLCRKNGARGPSLRDVGMIVGAAVGSAVAAVGAVTAAMGGKGP